MRVDADLLGSAIAGAVAAAAVIGTWRLQPLLAILLGLVLVAGAVIVWRRHHSFQERLGAVARQAAIEFLVLAVVAVALDVVLVDARTGRYCPASSAPAWSACCPPTGSPNGGGEYP